MDRRKPKEDATCCGEIRRMLCAWRSGWCWCSGAYWAGARWGQRQPRKVEAFRSVPTNADAHQTSVARRSRMNVQHLQSGRAGRGKHRRRGQWNTTSSWSRCRSEGAGSGFVIDPRGYILTNYHVVQGAQAIEVTLGDRRTTYTAKFIGADQRNDIALVKIDPKGRRSSCR